MAEPTTGASQHPPHLAAGDVDAWLAEQSRRGDATVFWASCRTQAADWLAMSCVEQLAVHVSTSIRADNNVCFAIGARGLAGRSTNIIGLVTRPTPGWAVIINNGDRLSADVRRIGNKNDNYDSFSSLSAAQISWAWVTTGRLPSGLTIRARTP